MNRQRGYILPSLLLVSLLATALWLLPPLERRSTLAEASLAIAKEALIARAVNDDNRPGSLPCPDLMTDSKGLDNHPGDGKADMFTLTQCPSYLGWLPWRTLDLPELLDDSGTRLWYAIGPGFRDDDSAQPINSDTVSGLKLDGNPEIAALIIAPRTPLEKQQRPSQRPSDYLEGENATNQRSFVSRSELAAFNDHILSISRQELMAATEKRVIGEVRQCLLMHAASSANPQQRFPWPAPLPETAVHGHSGSLFGRLPRTQPDNPSLQLGDLQRTLESLAQQLSTAALDRNLQTLLGNAVDQGSALRNFADALFGQANTLKQQAEAAYLAQHTIENNAANMAADGRISRSEGSLLRGYDDAALSANDALIVSLTEHGIDPLSWRIGQLALALQGGSALAALQSEISTLLGIASSPRPEVGAAIDTARNALDLTLKHGSTASVSELADSLAQLQTAVKASQSNISTSDLEAYRLALAQTLALPVGEQADSLNKLLQASELRLRDFSSGQSKLRLAAENTRQSLLAAIVDPALAPSAARQLSELQQLLAEDESLERNLTLATLRAQGAGFRTVAEQFASIDTANPRPVQRDIVPYVQNVGTAAVKLAQLFKTIGDHAQTLAPLAKAQPLPANTAPEKAVALDTSVYRRSEVALAGITGKNQSLDALRSFLANDNAQNRDKLVLALGTTQQQLSDLLAASKQLGGQLPSSNGSAWPMLWLSARCDFLRAGNWWAANRWEERIFYQIAGILPDSPGKLSVNGRAQYQLVVIAAGAALASQSKGSVSQRISDYFEGEHASKGREGHALQPETAWQSRPASTTFNDRLSY